MGISMSMHGYRSVGTRPTFTTTEFFGVNVIAATLARGSAVEDMMKGVGNERRVGTSVRESETLLEHH